MAWGNFLTLPQLHHHRLRAVHDHPCDEQAERKEPPPPPKPDDRTEAPDRNPRPPEIGFTLAEKTERAIKVVADNRKARFNYAIEDTFEAGIALDRHRGQVDPQRQIDDRGILRRPEGGEIWLINANIPEYLQGNRNNHEPKRRRKLLLHRRRSTS